MEELESIRDFGCRILIVANGIYDENGHLCVDE
jgi:hypothetical protein